MSARRLYAAVAICAAVVYVGALWNQFALDDNQIVRFNNLVLQFSGVWRAFVSPYWPPVNEQFNFPYLHHPGALGPLSFPARSTAVTT